MCYSLVAKLGGMSVAWTSRVVPGQKELPLQATRGTGRVVVPGLCCLEGIFETEGRVQLTVLVGVCSPCIFDPQNRYVTEVPITKVYVENCCYCTALPLYPGNQVHNSLQESSPATLHSERLKFRLV